MIRHLRGAVGRLGVVSPRTSSPDVLLAVRFESGGVLLSQSGKRGLLLDVGRRLRELILEELPQIAHHRLSLASPRRHTWLMASQPPPAPVQQVVGGDRPWLPPCCAPSLMSASFTMLTSQVGSMCFSSAAQDGVDVTVMEAHRQAAVGLSRGHSG